MTAIIKAPVPPGAGWQAGVGDCLRPSLSLLLLSFTFLSFFRSLVTKVYTTQRNVRRRRQRSRRARGKSCETKTTKTTLEWSKASEWAAAKAEMEGGTNGTEKWNCERLRPLIALLGKWMARPTDIIRLVQWGSEPVREGEGASE